MDPKLQWLSLLLSVVSIAITLGYNLRRERHERYLTFQKAFLELSDESRRLSEIIRELKNNAVEMGNRAAARAQDPGVPREWIEKAEQSAKAAYQKAAEQLADERALRARMAQFKVPLKWTPSHADVAEALAAATTAKHAREMAERELTVATRALEMMDRGRRQHSSD